ncbi:MAG TPA: histidine phosphatase family protein [Anaerolineales bacterium]|nr:histidine phosphatase family protein [Anaerolineales bacterium]
MQLYFLRHAQSESNARWQDDPDTSFHFPDPGLTTLGQRQAEAVAQALARRSSVPNGNPHDPGNRTGYGITHIYSSLMHRAVETATAIGDALNLPIHGRTDLHEWGGIYSLDAEKDIREGLPGNDRAFFESRFPRLELPPDFKDDGWWGRPYEPRTDVPARTRRVFEDLMGRHRNGGDRVLVVSHGGFLNFLLAAVVNLTADQAQANLDANFWFVLNNTGLTRVDIGPMFCGIVYHNRIDHLGDDLIS